MPKTKMREAVLHDWVCDLPFQMQALLMTAIRGPDENNKYNAAKAIVRYLRGVVIKPAANWANQEEPVGLNNNDFMWGEYKLFAGYADAFFNDHDEYPHHFIMHLVHCAEVLGYKHPIPGIRSAWNLFYRVACETFHMNPETEEQMDKRLNDFGFGVHNQETEQNKEELFILRVFKELAYSDRKRMYINLGISSDWFSSPDDISHAQERAILEFLLKEGRRQKIEDILNNQEDKPGIGGTPFDLKLDKW